MTGQHPWSLSVYCCLEDSVSWHFLFYESFIFYWILSLRATIIVTCFTFSRVHDMHLVTRSSLSATVYLMIHYMSLQMDDSWNITPPPLIHRCGTPKEKLLESKLSVLNNSHTLSSTHNSGDGQTVAGCLNRDMLQPCILSSPWDPLHRENKGEKWFVSFQTVRLSFWWNTRHYLRASGFPAISTISSRQSKQTEEKRIGNA